MLLLVSLAITHCEAWSPIMSSSIFGPARKQVLSCELLHDTNGIMVEELPVGKEQSVVTRRAFWGAAVWNIGMVALAPSVLAATDGVTVYKSGKAPIVPGVPAKDKSDVKGTRKDPDFLRSVADCRSQCQNTPGSDGYARSKEDCLSECQDICCKTYEQCTFDIVPRI